MWSWQKFSVILTRKTNHLSSLSTKNKSVLLCEQPSEATVTAQLIGQLSPYTSTAEKNPSLPTQVMFSSASVGGDMPPFSLKVLDLALVDLGTQSTDKLARS